MNLELKQVALILTLLMPAVGFYYTTNVRLEALEEKVVQLEKKVKKVAGKKNRRNKNAKRRTRSCHRRNDKDRGDSRQRYASNVYARCQT